MSFRHRRRPRVKEPEEDYFPLRGGLDLVTAPYKIPAGKMLDCFRYEIAPSGGAKPIDGFERIDGIGAPSAAVFQYVEFSNPATEIAVGTLVVGSVSGATGISVLSGFVDFEGEGDLEDTAGTSTFLLTSSVAFEADEDILVLSLSVATITTAYTPNTELIDSHENYFHWLAVEARRNLVEKLPGSGAVRGVWRYAGDLYGFRDNVGATECIMYKEDPITGWAIVTTPILSPGGSYKFENTNFGGSASTIMMYGCDGVNKAFQFDGTTFTQITTGMAVDAPITITEHVKHLFLGFPGGSLQHSPPTDPTGVWSIVVDAGELGMGEELGDCMSLPGGVLGIWCKDSIHILEGTGVGSWILRPHSKKSGGVPGTVQDVGRIIFLNNTGLADFSATNQFGSFKSGTISRSIQALIDDQKSKAVGSVAVASKNQYRIFFDDGYWLTATFNGNKAEFTQAHYSPIVRCISAPKRADDELENIYFGSDDGYIYKMDSGVSLDHEPMMAYCRLPYNYQKTPRRKKRYREIVLELDQFGGTELQLSYLPDFSFSRSNIPSHKTVDVSESTAGAGKWNISSWNTFSWEGGKDGGGGGTASGRMDGVATEVGLMLYFNAPNTVTPLHTINGIFTYYNFLGRQA